MARKKKAEENEELIINDDIAIDDEPESKEEEPKVNELFEERLKTLLKLAKKKKNILENAFTKYPQSQGILIGLINYYMASGENTDRLFNLIADAKKNEPNNASLYYVEGQINEKLGKFEEASKAYDECVEINPNYAYGYVGKGILYYNKAIEIQEAANNEMDDAKWAKLVEEFEATLKGCVDPFIKAYEKVEDASVKPQIAEYIKNACYRFSSNDEQYKALYEKYAEAAAQK